MVEYQERFYFLFVAKTLEDMLQALWMNSMHFDGRYLLSQEHRIQSAVIFQHQMAVLS